MRRYWILLPVVLSLSACGAASDEELRQWMTAQRNQVHPRVKPIPEPKQFTPESYTQPGDGDPFSNQRLTQALRKDATQTASNGALLAPELARRKEPLEEFPLDAMVMVGSVSRAGQPLALLTVGKLLYQVHLGDHLGQNYGKVVKISETEIGLREIVQDATGEWIERTAALQLQERSK